MQVLIKDMFAPFQGDHVWVDNHERTNLQPYWEANNPSGGTQVLADNCFDGDYVHANYMIIEVPWPWMYTGVPMWTVDAKQAYVDC